MSYLRKRYGRRAPLEGLGSLSSAVGTALDVGRDPYLPEVICRTSQLAAIEAGNAVPVCAETPGGLVGGIGLRKVMTPLRAYVYAEQHKWVYPVALAAIIGLPLLLGYELGKD